MVRRRIGFTAFLPLFGKRGSGGIAANKPAFNAVRSTEAQHNVKSCARARRQPFVDQLGVEQGDGGPWGWSVATALSAGIPALASLGAGVIHYREWLGVGNTAEERLRLPIGGPTYGT